MSKTWLSRWGMRTLSLLACALNSCYTNINQMWFRGHRDYVGYHLDYRTDPSVNEWGLPSVLYRCGEDWYLAAVRCALLDDYPYSGVQDFRADFFERHAFSIEPEGVYFHKITPELASWLLRSDQESHRWFTGPRLREQFARAGGEWMPVLPQDAQRVPAPYLEYAKRRLMLTELERNDAAWYAYPMAGLTFVCVDVPATVGALVFYPLAFVASGIVAAPAAAGALAAGVAASAAYEENFSSDAPHTAPKPKGSSKRHAAKPGGKHHGHGHHHHAAPPHAARPAENRGHHHAPARSKSPKNTSESDES